MLFPLVTSPLIGFFGALALIVALFWIFRKSARRPLAHRFRRLQVLSAGFMAFAHGSNDAQKTMGIITLALVSAGLIPGGDKVEIPSWVIVVSATAISLGTAAGGWRIMRTMGHRVVELEPITGFAAETTAATVIYTAAHFGMPVSTTHVISSAIMGVGTSKGDAGRALGGGPQHRHRLGGDDPGNRDRRRPGVARPQRPRRPLTHPEVNCPCPA